MHQLEKPKNELISRRDDEIVPKGTLRRSNVEISHLLASLRAGEYRQAASLLVVHVPSDTHRSSRLAACLYSLRSIDACSYPTPPEKISTNSMKIVVKRDFKQAKLAAVAVLNHIFKDIQEKPALFLSSGGSSLTLLDTVATDHTGPQTTLGVLDERYTIDPMISNFAQFSATPFFKKAQEQGAQSINTSVQEGESHEQLAERFEQALKAWKKENPKGVVIVTQGVGPDGHTTGIFPAANSEQFTRLFDQNRWVVGYTALVPKEKYPQRVTVTLPFLRDVVDHSIVYMVGEEKRDALQRMLQDKGALWETPARIVHEMKNVTLYTDVQYK